MTGLMALKILHNISFALLPQLKKVICEKSIRDFPPHPSTQYENRCYDSEL